MVPDTLGVDGEISIHATVQEVHNAASNVATSPAASLTYSICIALINEPGETHEQNVALQTERGQNHLFEMVSLLFMLTLADVGFVFEEWLKRSTCESNRLRVEYLSWFVRSCHCVPNYER